MTSSVRGAYVARLLGHWHALPGSGRSPDYVALAGAIRGLLADGRLPVGVRLPAERELARALRVGRQTVTAAYRELRVSGHLTSRRGAGSWSTLPRDQRVASSGLWTPRDEPDILDLGCVTVPAPSELLPAARAAAEDLPRYLDGAGYHPTGVAELREAIAQRYTARGLTTSAEQVMVTSGTQHALNLVFRLTVPAGAGVLVESPTAPNALFTLATRRARIATCSLDASGGGWDADLLLNALQQIRPRLAYLIPEFQHPTGHLMPAELREQVVAAAHASGTTLVIDESFVDILLEGSTMPPPTAAFDRSRVICVGGMSKPYWGGLRVGWVRAAAPFVQRLAALRVGVDMASPVLDQLVAVRLLAQRETILPARCAELVERRDVLAIALGQALPEWRFTLPHGGLTLWAELDGPISSALARAAEEVGLRLAPGPRFGIGGTLERFLPVPFTLPAPALVNAVERLAAVRHDPDSGLVHNGSPRPPSPGALTMNIDRVGRKPTPGPGPSSWAYPVSSWK